MRHIALVRSAALASAAWLAACSSPSPPPVGVLVDEVRFEKTEFFRGPEMNLVSDLREGDFDGDGAPEILAVAQDGAHLLSPDGREKRFASFRGPERPWAARAVLGAPDGKLRYAGNLPQSGKTVLFDEAGAAAWLGPGKYYGEVVPADANGDGRPEIVVATDTGIAVLGLDGALLGTIEAAGKPLFFDAGDMDGDGRADLVTENVAGGKNEMTVIFGDEGRAPVTWMAPHAFYRFTIERGAEGRRPSILILSDDAEELVLLDTAGATTRRLQAPWSDRLAAPYGMPMQVAGDGKGFVCLGDSRGSRHYHIAYVYNAAGDLVYADSAADNAGALLALGSGERAGAFLVGGRNVIWKYVEKR